MSRKKTWSTTAQVSGSCWVLSQPPNTAPHNVHTYGSAQRHNESPSKSSHSSIPQLSLISFSADEGTDCSGAHHEMADGVVCFQSELFHNFQSAVAEVESLSCCLSEQLVKSLLSESTPPLVEQHSQWVSSGGKLKSNCLRQSVFDGGWNEVNDHYVRFQWGGCVQASTMGWRYLWLGNRY